MSTRKLAPCLALAACVFAAAGVARAQSAPVTVAEDDHTYTLANGVVTVRVAKASGDLLSVRYKDLEMLATFTAGNGVPDLEKDPPGANPNGLNKGMTDHQYGFWSHDAMGPRGTSPAIARITIDPKSNERQRAEVSVKGLSNGRPMGAGPGGSTICDVEIRWSLGADDSAHRHAVELRVGLADQGHRRRRSQRRRDVRHDRRVHDDDDPSAAARLPAAAELRKRRLQRGRALGRRRGRRAALAQRGDRPADTDPVARVGVAAAAHDRSRHSLAVDCS